jgi:transposase InsO family protein
MQKVRNKRTKLNTEGVDNLNSINLTIDESVENLNLMQIDGTPQVQADIRRAVIELKKAFSTKLNEEPAKIKPMELKLVPDSVWNTGVNSQPPRQQSRLKAAEILAQVDKMLKSGIIRASQATAYSQVMMTPKTNGEWRFCVDFRRLNVITEPNRFPLPRIKDMLNRLGEKKAKYYAVLDLTKGYYQAPLSEASKLLTAFITPNGLYEWNRVAMGLTGAPGYFQRAMATEVLHGLMYTICELYLDDIIVFGRTREEFIHNLRAVLQRLIDHNITINPKKCKIGLAEVEYVGHTIDSEGIHFSREKLQKVISINKPTTAKQLKSFLGLANYFRDHIRNHSMLVEPLTRLLDNYNPRMTLQWDEITTIAFEETKKAINECPKLFFMDHEAPVHLYTDASDTGIGGYLCQLIDSKEVPIAFYSKSLTKEEKKWGTPCLEGYAIYRAFQHFHYLLRDAHTHVHTDHLNLIYIKDAVESKVIRWKLELQEYSFKLFHVKGVDNPIGDFWSRNEAADEDDFVIDAPLRAVNMLNSMNTHSEEDASPCCDSCSDNHTQKYMVGKGFAMYAVDTTPLCGICNPTNHLNVIDTQQIFTIPQAQYAWIQKVHNELAGHHGVEITLEKLNKAGRRWQFMREHVRRFITDCGFCQKNTYTGYEIQVPRYVAGRYQPQERWAIDTIHTNGDTQGNHYVVAIIDCFSRFLGLYPVKSLMKEDIASALLFHTGIFGVPSEIVSDNGSDYVNDVIKEMLEYLGSKHITSLAYSKEENGIVERSNKETWRWLRALLYDRRIGRNNITAAIPFVTRIHNSTKVKSLGYSPAQINFGERVELDKNIFLPETARNDPDMTVTEWMIKHREIQDTVIRVSQELQEKHDRNNKTERTSTDKENGNTEFAVGSFVLVSYPRTDFGGRRPNKKLVMHRGPYEVTGRTGLEYQLRNLVSKKLINKPVFLLRPFHYDATRTNPQDVALMDHDDEFHIDQILSHTGRFGRKTQMTFKVRWEGYDDTYDTDEPWSGLKYNDVFREYVTNLGYARTLPSDRD